MTKLIRNVLINTLIILAVTLSVPHRFIKFIYLWYIRDKGDFNIIAKILSLLYRKVDYPICYVKTKYQIMYTFFGFIYNIHRQEQEDNNTFRLIMSLYNNRLPGEKSRKRGDLKKLNGKLKYSIYVILNKYGIIDN